MRAIDADALLERVQDEEIQAQAHGREFSTCFMSSGGTPSTEWWYVEDLIENAPTIEPERKKGKWNTYYHSDIDFSHSCNQCGYSAPYQMIGGKVFQKKWNFCPNCGADMRGDDHDL